jgi:putative membrane protein (TIGR04086 family)
MAELVVFAVVFPTLYLFGQQAFLASILIASAVSPFIFAIWVGRRVQSRFVLHGGLVGVVAALIYIGLSWGQPQPLLYHISHVFKIAGGAAGGIAASRRQAASTPLAQP